MAYHRNNIEYCSPVYRNVQYRLLPGSPDKVRKLSRTVGACRWVWNRAIETYLEDAKNYKEGIGSRPPVSASDLYRWFTKLRRETSWLQELSYGYVRYVLKYQADAWQAAFKGAGMPRYKSKSFEGSFTIPGEKVAIRNNRIHIERVGKCKLRRRGLVSHPINDPVKIVIRRQFDKWYAVVTYRFEEPAKKHEEENILGIDMNSGQVACSNGAIYPISLGEKHSARSSRHRRKMERCPINSSRKIKHARRATKASYRVHNIRKYSQHSITKEISQIAKIIAMEDLKVFDITGNKRSIFSRKIFGTGWFSMRKMLEYKADSVVIVSPIHTSQTCYVCGHVDIRNRINREDFVCVNCNNSCHADINAAINIEAKASETGASGRREALPSKTRQHIDRLPINKSLSRIFPFDQHQVPKGVLDNAERITINQRKKLERLQENLAHRTQMILKYRSPQYRNKIAENDAIQKYLRVKKTLYDYMMQL